MSYRRDGDRNEILKELMEAYGRDVWNFAYSITLKAEAADDIAQNTFLKIYENLYSYRGRSSVKTWILAITRNCAYDFKRSAFIKKVTLVSYLRDDYFSNNHASAEEEAIHQLEANEVWQIVLSLPGKFREPLVLYAHHQLSMAEIATMLNVSEGTVKSRLHRARIKVSKGLKEGERYA